MMYKIETHMHTLHTSACGHLNASELVPEYIKAGFGAVVVTDHFNRATVKYLNIDLKSPDAWRPFFYGYDEMKKAAEGTGLNIILGTEVRFDGSENDYLVYGFEPDKIFRDPDAVMSSTLAQFKKKCEECGAVIIQAHPFRDGCYPSPPELLDGIEVLNLHPRQNNNNSQALKFAHDNNKLMTAGSDCHRKGDFCRAGILSEWLPKDTFDMARLIKENDYLLFCRPDYTVKKKYVPIL